MLFYCPGWGGSMSSKWRIKLFDKLSLVHQWNLQDLWILELKRSLIDLQFGNLPDQERSYLGLIHQNFSFHDIFHFYPRLMLMVWYNFKWNKLCYSLNEFICRFNIEIQWGLAKLRLNRYIHCFVLLVLPGYFG